MKNHDFKIYEIFSVTDLDKVLCTWMCIAALFIVRQIYSEHDRVLENVLREKHHCRKGVNTAELKMISCI